MFYIEFYHLKKKEDQILERTDGRMFGMKWVLKCSWNKTQICSQLALKQSGSQGNKKKMVTPHQRKKKYLVHCNSSLKPTLSWCNWSAEHAREARWTSPGSSHDTSFLRWKSGGCLSPWSSFFFNTLLKKGRAWRSGRVSLLAAWRSWVRTSFLTE